MTENLLSFYKDNKHFLKWKTDNTWIESEGYKILKNARPPINSFLSEISGDSVQIKIEILHLFLNLASLQKGTKVAQELKQLEKQTKKDVDKREAIRKRILAVRLKEITEGTKSYNEYRKRYQQALTNPLIEKYLKPITLPKTSSFNNNVIAIIRRAKENTQLSEYKICDLIARVLRLLGVKKPIGNDYQIRDIRRILNSYKTKHPSHI